jgi:hypothetical protein
MAPKLRILLSSGKAYPPTLDVTVNCETPTRISTELFDGEVSVFVRGFGGENCAGDGSCYFDAKDRGDMTYGLIVKGECRG